MSSPTTEPSFPPLDEATVRAHAGELRALAAGHGVTGLRFASPGRLVGHLAGYLDAFDVADFEIAALGALGAKVELYSCRVPYRPLG